MNADTAPGYKMGLPGLVVRQRHDEKRGAGKQCLHDGIGAAVGEESVHAFQKLALWRIGHNDVIVGGVVYRSLFSQGFRTHYQLGAELPRRLSERGGDVIQALFGVNAAKGRVDDRSVLAEFLPRKSRLIAARTERVEGPTTCTFCGNAMSPTNSRVVKTTLP